MQSWTLSPAPAHLPQAAVAGVVGEIGRPRFAGRALAHLNDALEIGSWSVYQLWPDRPPRMHLSASHGIADTTAGCFAIYRDGGLYRRDGSFAAVREGHRPGHAVMLRMHADEAPSADHREAIYVRHGMLERLSVARIEVDGSLLAVNLYRHVHQGRFDDAALLRFGEIGPALLAAVARHVEWADEADVPAGGSRRAALKARCAALTARELDVLERVLQGLTYDGIAADLGLSVATVKTYRLRAFERLNIHFKNELFASFVPGAR